MLIHILRKVVSVLALFEASHGVCEGLELYINQNRIQKYLHK